MCKTKVKLCTELTKLIALTNFNFKMTLRGNNGASSSPLSCTSVFTLVKN